MFDWASYTQTKGAVKLHLVLSHQGYLPQYAVITDGKTADIKVGPWSLSNLLALLGPSVSYVLY